MTTENYSTAEYQLHRIADALEKLVDMFRASTTEFDNGGRQIDVCMSGHVSVDGDVTATSYRGRD